MPPRKEKIFEITSLVTFNFKLEGATNATLIIKSYFCDKNVSFVRINDCCLFF